MKVADLVEAEGRTLLYTLQAEGRWMRGYLAGFGVALVCVVGSVVLLLGGIALVGIAGFLWLQQSLGTPAAACIVGLILLALGALSLWMFHFKTRA